MKLITNGNFLRKLTLISIMSSVSLFAWGQHDKKSPPPKAAPAPHASAPRQSAPSHSNAPGGQHNAPGGQHNAQQGGQHNMGPGGQHGGNNSGPQHGANNGGQHNMGPGGQHNMGPGGQHNMGPGGQRGGNGGNQHAGPGGNQHGGPGGNQHGGVGGNQHGGVGGDHNGNMAHGGAGARGGPGGHANNVARGRQVTLKGGGSAHIRQNGQIRSVNRNGMHIDHPMHGQRRVVSTRNGVRVVSVGHRGGYVQRAYVVRGGHSYYSRTYYYHGGYRSGVYRGYYYGGRPYYGYYPAYYYHPVYYGWAYNPWPAPVAYGWGWGGSPWYGYYGPYYQPYPVYPSAAYWIADFMIAATLQAAYEANANAWLGPDNSGGTLVASLMPMAADAPATAKLTAETKNAISEEVKLVIAAEKEEAAKPKDNSSGGSQTESKEGPPSLAPNFKTFIVSDDLSLDTEGDDCDLGQGDVVERTSDTPDDDANITVKVLASTKNHCPVGTEGSLSTDDLQEMYNHFRESLKDGMGELAKKNGTGGLPKAPDTATSNGDVPPPPPDKSAEKTLQDQASQADQTENEVKQEAGSGGGNEQ